MADIQMALPSAQQSAFRLSHNLLPAEMPAVAGATAAVLLEAGYRWVPANT
jgi:hypothetical protein